MMSVRRLIAAQHLVGANALSDPQTTSAISPVTMHTFEGIHIEVLLDVATGERYFVPKSIGEAVGYAIPSNLAKRIKDRWSEDLLEGEDYQHFSYAELREKFYGSNCDLRVPNTGRILLTEQGLYGIIMLTRAPKSRKFRRWLKAEVLPSLARDGSYVMPGAPAPVKVAEHQSISDPLAAMHLELEIIKARTKEKRLDFKVLLHTEKKALIAQAPATPEPIPPNYLRSASLARRAMGNFGIDVTPALITSAAKKAGLHAPNTPGVKSFLEEHQGQNPDGTPYVRTRPIIHYGPAHHDAIFEALQKTPTFLKNMKAKSAEFMRKRCDACAEDDLNVMLVEEHGEGNHE